MELFEGWNESLSFQMEPQQQHEDAVKITLRTLEESYEPATYLQGVFGGCGFAKPLNIEHDVFKMYSPCVTIADNST